MNVTELIERARDVAGERQEVANAPQAWTDAVVLRNLNAAYRDIWNRLRGADEQWGLDWRTLSELGGVATSIDGGIAQVVLPQELGDVVHVEESLDASSAAASAMPHVNVATLRARAMDGPYVFGGGRTWSFGGTNNVLLITKPDGLDLSRVRVWFARHVPQLARFSVTTYPTTSSLRVSVTADPALGAKPPTAPDAYRGVFFQCTSAPSGGTPQRLQFQCSGWTAATHPNYDLTLRTAHGLTSGTSEWETLPMLPEPHHEALVQLGVVRMYQAIGDVATARAAAAEAGRDLDVLIKLVETRQVQTPRFVNMGA